MELSDKDKLLIDRMSRQKGLFLTFSIVSVVIAVSLLAYYGLILRNMSSLRLVLIVLVFLAGRSHLRQYRTAVIFYKLKQWQDKRGDKNETYIK